MNKKLAILYIFCISFFQPVFADTIEKDTLKTEMHFPLADTVKYTQRQLSPNFKDKYEGKDFVYEVKPRAKTAWDRFWEWVGRLIRDLLGAGDKASNSYFLIYTLRTIAIALIGFVIYLIVTALLGKDKYWIFKRSSKKITAEEIMTEKLSQANFKELIEKTKQEGDYRLATRYYYLWLLKLLTYREIIEWHPDKTNTDYLYEITNTELKENFKYLSYIYDYIWYGEFEIKNDAFIKAEKAFTKTINTL